MINIITNEKACAEYALESLTMGEKPAETLSRIARYYYSEGHKKKEIEGLLEDFMLKCDPTVNLVKWQNTIDRVVKSSDKYGLIEIDGISVTQSEMEHINILESKPLRRLMFTMLCLAKYGNAISDTNNNWVNRKDKDIFSLANITVTTKKQSLMINDLHSAGYIRYSRVVDNMNLNVAIIDNDSPEVMHVTDFRNLGYQYLRYCGDKYIECQCCGKVVKEGHGRQKYCKECAVEVDRQKAVERYHNRLTL